MKLNNSLGLNNLNQATQQQDSLMKKLSSARRINSAADDAAGLLLANKLSSGINAKAQGERNLYDGISFARVYEQSLQGISDNLSELNRLAVAAGNGIYGANEREALQSRANQYIANIEQTISQSSFAGKSLFAQNETINFGTGSSSLGIEVADVTKGLADNNLFNFDVTSMHSASSSLSDITKAIDYISALQAQAGASINSFSAAASQINSQQIAESAARSRIEDLDFAKATSESVAADILANTSLTVASQARVQSSQAFNLLL